MDPKKKADKLISKGDKLLKKSKFDKALKKFKKARDLDPTRTSIYDRLISAHEQSTKEWGPEDVAESVGWLMEKQELENPLIKMTHAKLEPEWKEVTEKISMLLKSPDEGVEEKLIEEIASYREDAIYPLINTLMQIKHGAKEKKEEECQREKEE